MAFTHNWMNQGLHVKFFDTLTSEDLIKSNSNMVGETEFDKIKFLIVDFTDVTGLEVNDSDVNITVKFAIDTDHYNRDLKVASVSNNKELNSLIEKFIENTLSEVPHAQHKLFKNISDAETWFTS